MVLIFVLRFRTLNLDRWKSEKNTTDMSGVKFTVIGSIKKEKFTSGTLKDSFVTE